MNNLHCHTFMSHPSVGVPARDCYMARVWAILHTRLLQSFFNLGWEFTQSIGHLHSRSPSHIFLRFHHWCCCYVSSGVWDSQSNKDLVLVHSTTHVLSNEVELAYNSRFYPMGEWPSFRAATEQGYDCCIFGGCQHRSQECVNQT